MQRFYFELWFFWALRVVLCNLFLGAVLASLITVMLYIKQGVPALDPEIKTALWELFRFWFFISLNLALLVALFRSVKYLFNRPHAGYVLRLKKCAKEDEPSRGYIDPVGYGNLVKVWRKWFMLLIWIVGSFMVLALIATYLFTPYEALFDWFNIYVLYGFILAGGYLSFIFMTGRCKNIRIVKC
ncbi:hypothetical protein [Sulfurimonas paralvinellae]|uniref:Uncharacterized protein n=1 Tax=Sulfurimonas paralvinellae TaxID=317658 RepID=A0A7M1B8V9_9BACT|nr:hypothetical protein [Sulfurimonas paralvinellae]QOP46153.1 hypothetical protein FM071_07550 [Sulfurimonas paralvinellae]